MLLVAIIKAATWPGLAWSAMYYVPTNGDTIIGQIQYVTASQQDTLLDIARQYDLGYNEIVAANPGVDPWLPEAGDHIIIPSRFILPQKPWQGIIINLAEMRLYYFKEQGAKDLARDTGRNIVYTFPIGIGQSSSLTPLGHYRVIQKIKDPAWTVPQSVLDEALREGIEMPGQVPPGENNPLGHYAMQLDAAGILIHGTNKPLSIGRRVSRGCLRLYPEDIEQLVMQVPRGASVRIVDRPVKLGVERNELFVESNVESGIEPGEGDRLVEAIARIGDQRRDQSLAKNALISRVIDQAQSLPIPIKVVSGSVSASDDGLRYLYPQTTMRPNIFRAINETLGSVHTGIQSGVCHSGDGDPCFRIGPFDHRDIVFAVAEFIRYGFGLRSRIIEVH